MPSVRPAVLALAVAGLAGVLLPGGALASATPARQAPPPVRGGDVVGEIARAQQGEPDRPAEGGAPRPLTPELVARCLEVAREIDPTLADGLIALRERDPAEFERRLQRSRRLIGLAELKDTDPASYDLKLLELRVDAEVRRLTEAARTARAAGNDDRLAELERELLTWMRLQAGFALKARQDYLDRLRDHLARLERALDDAKATFDDRVETRVADLLTLPSADRAASGTEGGADADDGAGAASRPAPSERAGGDRSGAPDRWGRELQRPAAGGRPLSAAFVQQCLAVAREIDPSMGEGLETLQQNDPTEFERRLRQSRRLLHLAELKESDPALYELKLLEMRVDADVRRLSQEARAACLAGDEERMTELERDLLMWIRLQEGFALKSRQDYLDRLREHLVRLEQELEEGTATFDERVEARVRDILAPPTSGRPVDE